MAVHVHKGYIKPFQWYTKDRFGLQGDITAEETYF